MRRGAGARCRGAAGLLLAALLAAGCAAPGPAPDGTAAGEPVRPTDDPDLAGSARVFEQARQRGIDFRAVGQEPGWLLEIAEGGSTLFTHGYGSSEVRVPTPRPAADGAGRTTYTAASGEHHLQVAIAREECADTMSGEVFEARVEVVLDGARYSGCGRWLGD
ncbi:MAG TPA: hypothetical protein VHQ65_03470 [Thermoanaerobaculia bacterium]|nr:hypothetical protein [Thermoanaerobaculia bacterium]